ncbi:hypothetical protein GAMM_10029 [Gammaproteobacteria bacterium]
MLHISVNGVVWVNVVIVKRAKRPTSTTSENKMNVTQTPSKVEPIQANARNQNLSAKKTLKR